MTPPRPRSPSPCFIQHGSDCNSLSWGTWSFSVVPELTWCFLFSRMLAKP